MAIRKIVTEDEEFLRKKSRPVSDIDQRIQILIDDMIQTLHHAKGAGIAAVQVGVLKRICIVDIGQGPIILINPHITEKRGKQEGAEGCLSYPKIYGIVSRPSYVKVEALNRNGQPILIEGKDFLARALCHEIDHLDGIVFKDLASKMYRDDGE